MSLAKLKQKYSGQAIPEWELKALTDPAKAEAPEPEKKRGRPKKVEGVADGVSDGN